MSLDTDKIEMVKRRIKITVNFTHNMAADLSFSFIKNRI